MQTTTINTPKTNRISLEIITFLIILAPVIFAVAIWDRLPETMPTHWNFDGQADGWKSRTWASLFLPLVNAGLFFFFHALPNKYYPFKAHFHKFPIIRVLIHGFGSIVVLAMLMAAQGYSVNMYKVVHCTYLLVFIVGGNYLSTMKSMSKMGLRNRWTLSSGNVWKLTHRFAGRLAVFGSLTILITSLLLPMPEWAFDSVFLLWPITVWVLPMIYAYVLYKKEQREKIMM